MQIEFYLLMAIAFVGIIMLGMYDIKKKNEVKLEQIRLERERVALEQKRIENENEMN